jgi:hypothetical protein
MLDLENDGMNDQRLSPAPSTPRSRVKPEQEPPRQIEECSNAGDVFDYWLTQYRQQLDNVCGASLDIKKSQTR